MRREAHQIVPKALRYIIGASILLLALMLFSEVSRSILGFCTEGLLGFWEMLAISTALLFCFFALQSLRRVRFHSSPPSQIDSDSSVPQDQASQKRFSSPFPRRDWRPLVAQLSKEEKRRLRVLMEERCFRIEIEDEEQG